MATTATRERPILFSSPMVRAILEGRKSQTRRVVKPQPDAESVMHMVYAGGSGRSESRRCPYGVPGDRLWVREKHQHTTTARGEGVIVYAADDEARFLLAEDGGEGDLCGVGGKADRSRCLPIDRWRPSIHMPRWASRLTLEVVSVRAERLQSITWSDAIAEGMKDPRRSVLRTHPIDPRAPRVQYAALWDEINGKGSWESGPWVWVVEFRRS